MPSGGRSSSTMIVMMMAMTPSLNASTRPLVTVSRCWEYWGVLGSESTTSGELESIGVRVAITLPGIFKTAFAEEMRAVPSEPNISAVATPGCVRQRTAVSPSVQVALISLLFLAVLGGILAVGSPCVLPVLPFILARSGRSILRDTMPFLLGMMIMFAAAGSVAGAGVLALLAGTASRRIAPIILCASAIAVMWPGIGAKLFAPFVALGSKVMPRVQRKSTVGVAMIMGAATGLVWAPCAGPILALVLAGAAVGDLAQSSLVFVLLAFAAGSSAVFALILNFGDIVRKRFQSTWLRVHRAVELTVGVAALVAAILIFTGTDAQLFARIPTAPTAGIERALVHGLVPDGIRSRATSSLPDLGALPSLDGGIGWLNSAPITRESLKGKVTMIDIWTFACYNCLNALPHVKETAARYKDRGLVTIGVHTPELPRERVPSNVERAVKDLGIVFPVVLDNNYTIWKAFNNEYWPSVYVIDRKGRIRFHHDGEGAYAELDAAVATLLADKP